MLYIVYEGFCHFISLPYIEKRALFTGYRNVLSTSKGSDCIGSFSFRNNSSPRVAWDMDQKHAGNIKTIYLHNNKSQ